MTQKHTPTPYVNNAGEARIFNEHGAMIANCCGDYAATNAAFIARACNAHYELVAALHDAIDNYIAVAQNHTQDESIKQCEVVKKWKQAISKARGE